MSEEEEPSNRRRRRGLSRVVTGILFLPTKLVSIKQWVEPESTRTFIGTGTACAESDNIRDEGTVAADKRGSTWAKEEAILLREDEGVTWGKTTEPEETERMGENIGFRPDRKASPSELVALSFLSCYLQLSSSSWPR